MRKKKTTRAQNLFHAGLGLTKISREDLNRVFEELKGRGEAQEKDRDEFVSKTMKKIGKRGKNAARKVKRMVRKVLDPYRDRINAMNRRIDDLVRELKELKAKEKPHDEDRAA